MGNSSDDCPVLVSASDLATDSRPFLTNPETEVQPKLDDDFSDLDSLHFFRLQGADNNGYRIIRLVGKYYPARVVSGERLKRYVFHQMYSELGDGPFCIVYINSTVQTEDNSPGLTIMRWIYEELPPHFKDRLQIVYFIHPGLRSRLVIATLGWFFLGARLYWKIKYVNRLRYLWDDIKKEEIEIPEFVRSHDEVLEQRPLTDYGIEPDPFHLAEMPSTAYSIGKYEDKWAAIEYMS